MEAMRAVSSPHTKAPAPRRTSTSKLNWVSPMLLPMNPDRLALRMAVWTRSTARGYSART